MAAAANPAVTAPSTSPAPRPTSTDTPVAKVRASRRAALPAGCARTTCASGSGTRAVDATPAVPTSAAAPANAV